MKIAYFSPLSPKRSGIADYSEELLPYLAERAEITLFVDGFEATNSEIISRFEILDYRKQPDVLKRLDSHDAIIYHMGNDHRYHTGIFETMIEYPGILVLHDFALQDFFFNLARTRKDWRFYLDEAAIGGRYFRPVAGSCGRPPDGRRNCHNRDLSGIAAAGVTAQIRSRQIADSANGPSQKAKVAAF